MPLVALKSEEAEAEVAIYMMMNQYQSRIHTKDKGYREQRRNGENGEILYLLASSSLTVMFTGRALMETKSSITKLRIG